MGLKKELRHNYPYVIIKETNVEWNLAKSKLGQMELVRHSKINAFFETGFGAPIAYFIEK